MQLTSEQERVPVFDLREGKLNPFPPKIRTNRTRIVELILSNGESGLYRVDAIHLIGLHLGFIPSSTELEKIRSVDSRYDKP